MRGVPRLRPAISRGGVRPDRIERIFDERSMILVRASTS